MTRIEFKRPLWWAMPWLLALALAACGGSGGGDDGGADETAELTISLTDAEGDFNHYTVDVVSLTLHKANGAIVETLPNTVRLDFSQYVEVTEFLSTATVPVGTYKQAEITLDYGNALITVEDANGNSIPAQALDESGNPLGEITVDVMFNQHSGFQIKPGVPAAITLDFDLEASNEVTINGQSATLTVNPVLLANTLLEENKTQRLRGLLGRVQPDAGSFDVYVRPFRVRHRDFGKISAHTNGETVFEIDGVAYNQSEGLAVLAQQSGLTPVVSLGTFHFRARRYVAHQVYAGSSVPWGEKDVLKGSVVARVDNTLTVIGATIEFDDGHFSFNDEIEVLIDAETRVTKQGDPGNHHVIGDISVGQKVTVLGVMSDDGSTMNATGEGLVRMRYSQVSGLVASVSPLEVDLQYVNRRWVGRYNFAGTGIDPWHDADPEQYQIDTGALVLGSLALAEPVRVNGFPTPFGSAPLDFEAKTVIDLGALPTRMIMAYGPVGSPTAIVSLDDTGLQLELVSATRHYLKQAGIVTDIASLPAVPFIEPAGEHGIYAIVQGRRVDVYLDWDAYQAALHARLAGEAQVLFVIAKGQYDSTGLRLAARQLVTRITR